MPPEAAWDVRQQWIRVIERLPNGILGFEYAVGEPQLYVEMVMSAEAFAAFCAEKGVAPTWGPLPAAAQGSDAHEWDWNLHAARQEHFRHEP